MKKLIAGLSIIGMSAVIMAFSLPKTQEKKTEPVKKAAFEMPSSVKTIVDNSCYMCHNSNSRGDGKDKLNFDELSKLKGPQLVASLQEIVKVVSKDWMPPRRFLKDHPEKDLTSEQRAELVKWANDATTAAFKHHKK